MSEVPLYTDRQPSGTQQDSPVRDLDTALGIVWWNPIEVVPFRLGADSCVAQHERSDWGTVFRSAAICWDFDLTSRFQSEDFRFPAPLVPLEYEACTPIWNTLYYTEKSTTETKFAPGSRSFKRRSRPAVPAKNICGRDKIVTDGEAQIRLI
jgi:hypothetical protein